MVTTQTENHPVIRTPSSLLNTLCFGSEYFRRVYQLSEYLGKGQVSLDAAEILFQLVLRNNHEFILRSYLAEYLCMETQKVAKAISLLKKLGMIKSHNKGLLLVSPIPHNREWTNDETFEFFNVLHSLEYEGAWEKIWDLMSLIYTIQDWMGLGIPDQSRRHFVVCLCMGQPFGCCDKTAKIVMDSILNLDLKEVGEQFSIDDYRGKTEKHVDWLKESGRCRGVYQKAKKILTTPYLWDKDVLPYYYPQKSIKVAKLARTFFPFNDKEPLRTTLNKQNIYTYEYLVHQPLTNDYDFNPFSPFYGLPLETRLEILPDTIGQGCFDKYLALRQEQWKGVFNADETEFRKHTYKNKGYSVFPYKKRW